MTTDVPSYNLYKHVNSKLGRQHRKAAVAAAIGPFFMSLLYSLSNPWCDWYVKVGLSTGVYIL